MGDRHHRPESPAVRRALKAFAANLKGLRAAAGLTQGQLGAKAGLHWTSIARYEGKAVPSLRVALILAEALGVTVDGLAGASKPGRPRKESR